MFRPRRRINEGKEAGTMAMTVLWAGMAAAAVLCRRLPLRAWSGFLLSLQFVSACVYHRAPR